MNVTSLLPQKMMFRLVVLGVYGRDQSMGRPPSVAPRLTARHSPPLLTVTGFSGHSSLKTVERVNSKALPTVLRGGGLGGGSAPQQSAQTED
jgi:hypothetical protein